jgi:glycosyltransferase involved in cell wall biosynthesis
MRILLVEPFFVGSHASWASGFQQYSSHEVSLLTLPGRHWKWRMAGSAVELARQFEQLETLPDVIMATDMLDLATFLGLIRGAGFEGKTVLYFHENQITYPWSPDDEDPALKRDFHYGFKNFTSALAADKVVFNSGYHQSALLNALPDFLDMFPDFQNAQSLPRLEEKSSVLPIGMDLKRFDFFKKIEKEKEPVLLWNHRWEYDKDPDTFFKVLYRLQENGVNFKLVVLGESYKNQPPVFSKAKEVLQEKILHFGYAKDFETYARLLWLSDILPVTSRQDFFGMSAVEAMYCDTFPLLPNRLAFPGHLPPDKASDYLYNTESELFEKLNWACLNIDQIRQNPEYHNFVAPYDWTILAPRYDNYFLSMS